MVTAVALTLSLVLLWASWWNQRDTARNRRRVAAMLEELERTQIQVEAMLVDAALAFTMAARENELRDRFRVLTPRARREVLRRVETLVRALETET